MELGEKVLESPRAALPLPLPLPPPSQTRLVPSVGSCSLRAQVGPCLAAGSAFLAGGLGEPLLLLHLHQSLAGKDVYIMEKSDWGAEGLGLASVELKMRFEKQPFAPLR